MPFTSHGHPYGVVDVSQPRPPIARCGGPSMCRICSREVGMHLGYGVQPARLDTPPATSPAERIARAFHETYEALAPHFGYETRQESAVPWEQVPEQNKGLMIAVVGALLANGTIKS